MKQQEGGWRLWWVWTWNSRWPGLGTSFKNRWEQLSLHLWRFWIISLARDDRFASKTGFRSNFNWILTTVDKYVSQDICQCLLERRELKKQGSPSLWRAEREIFLDLFKPFSLSAHFGKNSSFQTPVRQNCEETTFLRLLAPVNEETGSLWFTGWLRQIRHLLEAVKVVGSSPFLLHFRSSCPKSQQK